MNFSFSVIFIPNYNTALLLCLLNKISQTRFTICFITCLSCLSHATPASGSRAPINNSSLEKKNHFSTIKIEHIDTKVKINVDIFDLFGDNVDD